MSLNEKLASGLAVMGVSVDSVTQQKLLDYIELIDKWNKVHNLTAVRDPNDMVTMHLLDSLSVLPCIKGEDLLDVGSGAGLPGIPLALVRPELKVTVMDSNHKKASFMRQAKAVLGMSNLEIVCGRVEEYHSEAGFSTIISRAFSDLSEFLRLSRHLLAEDGVWLAMKGVYPYDELAQSHGITSEVIPLRVPGLDAQRHLVIMKATP